VIVVGHGATKLALDHRLAGMTLEDAASQAFTWQPMPLSWRFTLAD